MLNRIGINAHPCLLPDLKKILSIFTQLNKVSTIGIFADTLYQIIIIYCMNLFSKGKRKATFLGVVRFILSIFSLVCLLFMSEGRSAYNFPSLLVLVKFCIKFHLLYKASQTLFFIFLCCGRVCDSLELCVPKLFGRICPLNFLCLEFLLCEDF